MPASAPLDLRTLKETAKDEKPQNEAKELVDRDHVFSVNYTSPEGKTFEAQIVSRIPDGDERIDIARIAAKRAGVKWDTLPAAQAARIWAQATLAVQLREPPAWLARWVLEDDALLFSCFDVCSTHEGEFFRFSGGKSSDGAERSRISIVTTLAASTD